MTPLAASTPLIAVELLASSIWIGGLVAIFVVARAANAALDEAARVEFFRALGRRYGIVAGAALLAALATGAILLRDHGWDSLLIVTVVVAAGLVATTAIGVIQARRMTRLRRRALAGSTVLQDQVRQGARLAMLLRGAIGALTLALLVLAAALAG